MFDVSQFSQRAQKLQEEIQISTKAATSLHQYLSDIQHAWNQYYAQACSDMSARLEEIDVAEMLSLIEQEATDLQTNELLQDELAELESCDFTSDQDLEQSKQKFKLKHAQFKDILNRKQQMFMELVLSVESLIALNDQHVKNESERMVIQAQVDANMIELSQLKVVHAELESQLEEKKLAYKGLKKEIAKLD